MSVLMAVMRALLEATSSSEMQHRALAALGAALGEHAWLWAFEDGRSSLSATWSAESIAPTLEPPVVDVHAREPLSTAFSSTLESALAERLGRTGSSGGLWLPIPVDGTIGWLVEIHGIATHAVRLAYEVLPELGQLMGNTLHRAENQRRLHEELAVSQAKLARLESSDVIGMMITSVDGRIVEANNAVLQLLGYGREEFENGLRWDFLTPSEWLFTDRRAIAQLEQNGVAPAWHKEYFRKDGSRVPILLGAASLGGDPMNTIVFVIDMTAQKQVESQLETLNAGLEERVNLRTAALRQAEKQAAMNVQALAASQMELRALAARLQTIREDQLRELAREIHDVMGQDLTVLKVDAAWLQRRLAEAVLDPVALSARVAEISDKLDSLVGKVRRLATELRPKILDDLGLVAAIESHAQQLAQKTGLTFELTLPDELVMDRDLATAIYRIYQELVTNVIRHARASRVEILVQFEEGQLTAQCIDDGIGFRESMTPSLGLVGIRERALAHGGSFDIRRGECGGTVATVCLPLEGASAR